jgi:hypothetical protein
MEQNSLEIKAPGEPTYRVLTIPNPKEFLSAGKVSGQVIILSMFGMKK